MSCRLPASLVLLATLAGGCVVWPEGTGPTAAPMPLDEALARRDRGEAVIVDVRSAAVLRRGPHPGRDQHPRGRDPLARRRDPEAGQAADPLLWLTERARERPGGAHAPRPGARRARAGRRDRRVSAERSSPSSALPRRRRADGLATTARRSHKVGPIQDTPVERRMPSPHLLGSRTTNGLTIS